MRFPPHALENTCISVKERKDLGPQAIREWTECVKNCKLLPNARQNHSTLG